MTSRKKVDLIVLILLEILATGASLYFQLDFLSSAVLYLVLPSAYLLFRLRTRTQWRRIAAMAAIFGLWYGLIFAYLADWNKAWAWPMESLPFGTWFGIVNPVEWLWVFLWISFTILFYEHFLERDRKVEVSPHYIWAVVPALLISIVVFTLTHYYPNGLDWPYAYAVLALLTLPPFIFLLVKRPFILPKLLLPSIFFIPVHLSYEITGLILEQWHFPGQYFWIVPLPGSSGVPIEEFLVWIVLGSTITLAYYELYIDDGK